MRRHPDIKHKKHCALWMKVFCAHVCMGPKADLCGQLQSVQPFKGDKRFPHSVIITAPVYIPASVMQTRTEGASSLKSSYCAACMQMVDRFVNRFTSRGRCFSKQRSQEKWDINNSQVFEISSLWPAPVKWSSFFRGIWSNIKRLYNKLWKKDERGQVAERDDQSVRVFMCEFVRAFMYVRVCMWVGVGCVTKWII